jgi:PPOX class probable F420-dependent enzyme
MATLTEKQAQLLTEPNFAVVATLRPDGSPQTSVVWIDWDGENVLFNTTTPRVKGQNLARDPRVSVLVFDLANPYRYVEIEGIAELGEEGADEHIARLALKYGSDVYARKDRVIVRVYPQRVHAYGID